MNRIDGLRSRPPGEMLSHGSKGDKDRWNLLSPTSKSLAKEFDFGDATKGGVGGVVKGKDRWNLLRDNVQSVSLQARGANAFSSVGRATSSPSSQRIQLFSSTLRRAAARQEKGEDLLESPGAISVLTASEPAPEPGVAGDSEVPPCQGQLHNRAYRNMISRSAPLAVSFSASAATSNSFP
eukprot:s615_g5.t1